MLGTAGFQRGRGEKAIGTEGLHELWLWGMMSSANVEVVNDSSNEDLCRVGTILLVVGLLIIALSGLLLFAALISISNETEGYSHAVIILLQIGGIIVGTVLAGTGCYHRYRHCA
jgi:hypothetical protein